MRFSNQVFTAWAPGWRGRAQQYQQFIETTAVRADHLAQRGESALQPPKVNAVACDGKSSRWLD